MPGVLTVDIGTQTGWAYAGPAQIAAWPKTKPARFPSLIPIEQRPDVRYGAVDLRQASDHGTRFARLRIWLENFEPRPAVIVFERPIPSGVSRNDASNQTALGFRAIILGWAAERGVAVETREVSAIKSWWGVPNRTKDKTMMIERAVELGWPDALTTHEADALAILDLCLSADGDPVAQQWRGAA